MTHLNPKTLLAAGLAVTTAGFLVLFLAWTHTVGADELVDQTPWIVVGSGVGAAVVATGLLLLNVATRRQEAGEVDRQLQRILAAIEGAEGAS